MSDPEMSDHDLFYPSRDIVCSEPFSRFLADHHAVVDQFFFVIKLVARIDDNRLVAAKALLPGANSDEERKRLSESIAQPDAMMKELKRHANINSQNLTNNIVNAFQRYFSSIIYSAALKQPKMMASSQAIPIEDVLRFSKHKDLVGYIIDRKVNELAYGGLSEMEKYFNDRLGIKMFNEKLQRDLLRLFIEVRNINTHNGGVVNDIFLTRVGKIDGFTYARGKRFHVDFDALLKLTDNAMRVALQIDSAVAEKFRLKTKAHRSWIAPKKPTANASNVRTAESDKNTGN